MSASIEQEYCMAYRSSYVQTVHIHQVPGPLILIRPTDIKWSDNPADADGRLYPVLNVVVGRSSVIEQPRPVKSFALNPTLQQLGTAVPQNHNLDSLPVSENALSSRPGDASSPNTLDLLQRIRKLEEASTSSPTRELSESGFQGTEVTLNKTRMLGSSHRLGWSGEFANIWQCYEEAIGTGDGITFQDMETKPLIAEMGELLHKCKLIARTLKVGRPSRSLAGNDILTNVPSRDIADAMAHLYFESFESTHRILHVPSFWAEYQRYWDNPDSVPNGSRLKILLVIGIGYSLSDRIDANDEFRNTVHQWIHSATFWLSGPLEKDRLSITGIQVHCLALLARQVFSVGGDLVWISTGSLVNTAMQIGLHRDPKTLPAISILQAEVRRRLWATVLELVMQASLDTAMPPRLSVDDFDTAAPSNLNDDEIGEAATPIQPHPRDTFTMTSMQLLLLDSMPTRLRALKLLTSLNSEISYLDVLALSTLITDSTRACTKFMNGSASKNVKPFHRNMIYFLIRRFLIPLHGSFANKARTNPLFQYSLTISLETVLAMGIISPEPDEGFSRLMAIGGGMFREGIRYAGTVICIAYLSQVEDRRQDGTLGRNSNSTNLLRQSMNDLISLSAERIRQGETNVKSHMFLSMALAQADAMEAGNSCEYSNARSAVDSLQFSYSILQMRAAGLSGFDALVLTCGSSFGEQEDYGMDFDLNFFMPDAEFM
ncbi:hypothetical protein VTL71DRAFT_13219 [Oculimacula yallundae]|uniref:Xylanolytic transcriptional activator regulatory domain-containing protein n=1 Tax=Oculimacula yallundae TaxID=86028 RepID=A0ABR4CLU7_9HELO